MKRLTLILTFLFVAIVLLVLDLSPSQTQSPNSLWWDVNETTLERHGKDRVIIPDDYRLVATDIVMLDDLLNQGSIKALTLPMPDGTEGRFCIEESPIMASELAAKFPQIKTYRGFGMDDKTATVRLDRTPHGFHAMILSTSGTVYIDPYQRNNVKHYVSYYKQDYGNDIKERFGELPSIQLSKGNSLRNMDDVAFETGDVLRTYRLALAATGEYTEFHGGTVADALSAMNTTMNRVNGIYERDLSIRMELIANNDQIIYTDSSTDPYTNNDAIAMLEENQSNLDTVIGTGNYDMGHVFSTNAGGVSATPAVCRSQYKAMGTTGRSTGGSGGPINDPFDVDLVAHEMGHQFGANHTFNAGNAMNCIDSQDYSTRNPSTAYEPASGSTIMAYAGICAPQNLQSNSDDHFHTGSFDEIIDYVTNGYGNDCATISNTGNTAPVVDAGSDYTIPASTNFTLTGSATDNEGNTLTYNWEEFDLGSSWMNDSMPNTDAGDNPIFRSYPSTDSPSRTFPKPDGGLLADRGESLPTTDRTMKFRLTVRDGSGGVSYDLMELTVASSAGPFMVTEPTGITVWQTESEQTVTWNVAGTDSAPISCSNVDILLSADGGKTFPYTLIESISNDGTEMITVPSGSGTSLAEVKVQCSDNVFFDISTGNFTIEGSSVTPTPTATSHTDATATSTPTEDVATPTATDSTVATATATSPTENTATPTATSTTPTTSLFSENTNITNLTGVYAGSIDLGDYDNDGDLDIALIGLDKDDNYVAEIYRNNGGTFADIGADLTGVKRGTVKWGDYDNDNDMDLLLIGLDSTDTPISKIYRNDNSTFNDANAGLTGVYHTASDDSADWGDYDNDGDLDIVIAGNAGDKNSPVYMSKIYRNDGGIFTDIETGLVGVIDGSVAWGDFDGNNALDILLSGTSDKGEIVAVYYNNDGEFSKVLDDLANLRFGDVAWGDYDADQKLDFIITGNDRPSGNDNGFITKIYHQEADFTFDLVSGVVGVGSNGSVDWGDYDNDNDLDLIITGCTVRGCDAPITRVYENNNGSFHDVGAGLPGVKYGSVAWGDYDNDDDLDILLIGETSGLRMAKIYQNNTDNPSTDNPILKLTKTGPTTAQANQTVAYTFIVQHATNSDGSAIHNITLSDDLTDAPTFKSGDANSNNLLDEGETWTYTVDYQIKTSDPNPLVNKATVQGENSSGNSIQNSDVHSIAIESSTSLPKLNFSETTYEIGEDIGQAIITVTLSQASSDVVSFDYQSSDDTATSGHDYTAAQDTVTMSAGKTQTTFNITIIDDEDIEDDETFSLGLSNPSNAELGNRQTVLLTILDNDQADYLIYLPIVLK